MRIGISGHRQRDGADWAWVRARIRDLVGATENASGYSSLAPGADRIFAEEIMRSGQPLYFVQPVFPDGAENYDDAALARHAAEIIPAYGPTPDEAYLAAGRKVADIAERMIFVWDGGPPRGLGGTADIVAYARGLGKSHIILDPVRRLVSGADEWGVDI